MGDSAIASTTGQRDSFTNTTGDDLSLPEWPFTKADVECALGSIEQAAEPTPDTPLLGSYAQSHDSVARIIEEYEAAIEDLEKIRAVQTRPWATYAIGVVLVLVFVYELVRSAQLAETSFSP